MPLAHEPLPVSARVAVFFPLRLRGALPPRWRPRSYPLTWRWCTVIGSSGGASGASGADRAPVLLSMQTPFLVAAVAAAASSRRQPAAEGSQQPKAAPKKACTASALEMRGSAAGRNPESFSECLRMVSGQSWAQDCGAMTRQVSGAEVALTSKHSFKNLLKLLWC